MMKTKQFAVKLSASMRLIGLPVVAVAGLLSAGQVFALGTTAGTTINNSATLTFAVGGTTQPTIGSSPTGNTTGVGTPTAFIVDRRINLSVATTDASPVNTVVSATNVVTSFTVTNSTNDLIDVKLSNIPAMAAGSVGATGADTSDFVNGTCTMHATLANAQANTSPITVLTNAAVDTAIPVFVRCNIQPLTGVTPAVATYADAQGKINVVSLVAQAAIAGGGAVYTQDTGADVVGTVQNVFGDEAGGAAAAGGTGTTNNGAGDTNDTYRDGKHSANSAYKLVTPILSVLKTEQLICDPLNGATNPKHIPGALVRYTITVANDATATSSGTLTSVLDTLDTNLLHDVNFVAGTNAATCVANSAPTSGGTAGSGFRLSNAVVSPATASTERPAGPVYQTNGADTDAASISGQAVTINYTNGLAAGGTHTAGEVKPGESVTIEFQAFVK